MDILGPDIGQFLLQYRGFPLSEVKNVLVTPVGTKIFVLMEVFSIESLIQRVCEPFNPQTPENWLTEIMH